MTPGLPPSIQELADRLANDDAEVLVAVFDRYGNYLLASDNHLQAVGYTAAELVEMNLAQLVIKDDHRAAWVLRTISVFYTRPMHFASRLVAKSGAVIKVAGTLTHVQDAKGDRYFITSVRVQ
jgi:PAS domain S-box-containing protein